MSAQIKEINRSVYTTLSKIDLSDKVEKKGRFSYVSWSDAVAVLLENYPTSTWEVTKWNGLPYCQTDSGAYVEVSVTVEGITRSQVHPVLNHQNKAIPKPNAFDVNTSIQRCLAKAIALHGLSLYIFRGEDLPPNDDLSKQVEPVPINYSKVNDAIKFFKDKIDEDNWDNAPLIKKAYQKLSSDEKLKVDEGLKDKAPDSNKMYKSILKDYINYEGNNNAEKI